MVETKFNNQCCQLLSVEHEMTDEQKYYSHPDFLRVTIKIIIAWTLINCSKTAFLNAPYFIFYSFYKSANTLCRMKWTNKIIFECLNLDHPPDSVFGYNVTKF